MKEKRSTLIRDYLRFLKTYVPKKTEGVKEPAQDYFAILAEEMDKTPIGLRSAIVMLCEAAALLWNKYGETRHRQYYETLRYVIEAMKRADSITGVDDIMPNVNLMSNFEAVKGLLNEKRS